MQPCSNGLTEEGDPFDPNQWERKRTCRIYDVDLVRYATVDEKYYAKLVVTTNRPPSKRQASRSKYGKLRPRLWYIKPLHPKRHDKKLYFVSNSGWREGGQTFLHVEVMRLTKKRRPSPVHTMVHHMDGDEWNCTEDNLRYVTPAQNRRMSKQSGKKR